MLNRLIVQRNRKKGALWLMERFRFSSWRLLLTWFTLGYDSFRVTILCLDYFLIQLQIISRCVWYITSTFSIDINNLLFSSNSSLEITILTDWGPWITSCSFCVLICLINLLRYLLLMNLIWWRIHFLRVVSESHGLLSK
jgi:hypothetical protein